MAIDVRLKHSSVDSKVPLPGDLVDGELALNINANSPAAYIKDSAGTVIKLAGEGSVGSPDASETAKGIAELATQVETDTGTDDLRIVTPLKLKTYVDNPVNIPQNAKYSVANDDAGLVGGTLTAAINAALTTNGDITGAGDLRVSDQCEVTDSGNPDANAAVRAGQYLWDGVVWFPGGGDASVEISDTAPTNPAEGDLWWDSVGGRMYIWYVDGSSSQWVDASPSLGGDYVAKAGDTMTGDLTVPNLTVPGIINNKQVAVAYGTITNTGALTYTHNIGAARLVGTNAYDLDFATPRADQMYIVVASVASSRAANGEPAVVLTCNQRSSTTFRITVRSLVVSGSNVVQGPGELVAISFAVFSPVGS